MDTEKTSKRRIIEEKEVIENYEEELKKAEEKIKQINSKQYCLKLVEIKKTISENIGGFIYGGLFLIGLKFLLPVLPTTILKIITSIAFLTVSLAAVIVQEYENRELNKKSKENPYYNNFKKLSKKECNKKQQELELEKKYELENIENLESCIKIERKELDSLIEFLAYLENAKETVGRKLEKEFLKYLDEKVDYSNIHLEDQTVDKVKIKTR